MKGLGVFFKAGLRLLTVFILSLF